MGTVDTPFTPRLGIRGLEMKMGVAAQHRGNLVIGWQLYKELEERRRNEETARQVQVAEECNAFVRAAMDYLIEPKGLRSTTVERMKTRKGWAKRHAAVVSTHSVWVDVDAENTHNYASASIKRAKAVHDLLMFALGTWTVPAHIRIPRAAS